MAKASTTTSTGPAPAEARMGFYEARFLDFAVSQKGDRLMDLAVKANKALIAGFAGVVVVAAVPGA